MSRESFKEIGVSRRGLFIRSTSGMPKWKDIQTKTDIQRYLTLSLMRWRSVKW